MKVVFPKHLRDHFLQHDKTMSLLLAHAARKGSTFTHPTPAQPSAYFEHLMSSIISQQISTKAASSILTRVHLALGTVSPQSVLAANPETLRSCGISPQKMRYIMHNAETWQNIKVTNFAHMDDESIITELTKLYGVGRWTAEMFCIFTLARPNVFSLSDLGLKQSICSYYNLRPTYTRKISATIATWSPYQSTAALLLWHARDTNFVL